MRLTPTCLPGLFRQQFWLTQPSFHCFSTSMAQKRIFVQKKKVHLPKMEPEPLNFRKPWDSKSQATNLKVSKVVKRAKLTNQPTPLHDYINFKPMSGNEILINLNNVENLG